MAAPETPILRRALIAVYAHPRTARLARRLGRLPGIGWLARRLARHVLPPGDRVWAQVQDGLGRGLWLKLDPHRETGYLRGCPEPGIPELLERFLRPGDCFFDVGAHVGFYSLIAGLQVGTQGRVVAFEPDEQNAGLLEENIQRNNLRQVVIVRAAAWRSPGRVRFFRGAPHDARNSTRRGHVVADVSRWSGTPLVEVDSITLDDYARGEAKPKLIKVDTEGSEIEVLQGAERLLGEKQSTFVIEVHHPQAADFLQRRFSENGYETIWLPSPYPEPFPRHLLAHATPAINLPGHSMNPARPLTKRGIGGR